MVRGAEELKYARQPQWSLAVPNRFLVQDNMNSYHEIIWQGDESPGA